MKISEQKTGLSILVLLLVSCTESAPPEVVYNDITELSGLQFAHQSGSDDSLALPPVLGSGVALFDMDNDLDLDIYFVQGAADASISDELWRNDTNGIGQRIRFSRITDVPAFASEYAGMGVAIEDANLDGYLDVLVTAIGRNRLLLNTRDGFITSQSEELGLVEKWSSSAVWIDVNLDGRPDAYIGNVAEPDSTRVCRSATGQVDYCGANAYEPQSDQLLINAGVTKAGDVVFEDASTDFGLTVLSAPSLGVRAGDFNADGWPDVYVTAFEANNALWLNRNGTVLRERALAAGAASSFRHNDRGSIGVDAADIDQDGDLDLVVSHHLGEPHQMYRNDGEAGFIATAIGVGGISEAHSGTGLAVFDANADGRDDVYVANGALRQRQSQVDASDSLPLRQANTLLLQHELTSLTSDEKVPVQTVDATTEEAGSDVSALGPIQETPRDAPLAFDVWTPSTEKLSPRPQVSRSVAVGDLDNDGDLDLVVTNNGSTAQVLENTVDPEHWFGIDPVSPVTGHTLVGTRMHIEASQVRPDDGGVWEARRTHGFLSSSDPRLLVYRQFNTDEPVNVVLDWPGGEREIFTVLPEARYHRLIKGQGNK